MAKVHTACLQVDVVEDESTGKRTIKTTSICWGNKLSLLVSTPFYDPRLPPNKDPDLDFSQAQIEVNSEADWVKVSCACRQSMMCACFTLPTIVKGCNPTSCSEQVIALQSAVHNVHMFHQVRSCWFRLSCLALPLTSDIYASSKLQSSVQ